MTQLKPLLHFYWLVLLVFYSFNLSAQKTPAAKSQQFAPPIPAQVLRTQDLVGYWVLDEIKGVIPTRDAEKLSAEQQEDILKQVEKTNQTSKSSLTFLLEDNGYAEMHDLSDNSITQGQWSYQNNQLYIKTKDKKNEEKVFPIKFVNKKLEMVNQNKANKGLILLMYFVRKEKK